MSLGLPSLDYKPMYNYIARRNLTEHSGAYIKVGKHAIVILELFVSETINLL